MLISAAPSFAYSREYIVTLNGERKGGSEVCFYRGESLGDSFSLYFTHETVACLPADAVVELPPGVAQVFARHRDGYVSGHADFSGEGGPARLEISLKPAGRADLSELLSSLERGERAGVWLAPTESEAGTYLPLVDGETELFVPAGRPFLPLVIANGLPVALGDAVTMQGGGGKILPFPPGNPASTDVVAWVKVGETSANRSAGQGPGAEISIIAAGKTVEPEFPLPAGAPTHTLMFFKGVPIGIAEVRIRGRTWVHSELEIQTVPGVTAVRSPIQLVRGAAVTVKWNTGSDSFEACVEDAATAAGLTATLLACTSREDLEACTPRAAQTARWSSSSSIEFQGVPAGAYKVQVRPPFASKPTEVAVALFAGGDEVIDVPLMPFRFFGTVRMNGKPVQARLFFESGEAQSDAAGRYSAALDAKPPTNLVRIAICDDRRTRTYIPERPLLENSVFDIDIREQLVVATVSTDAGSPVEGADLTFAPVRTAKPDTAIYYSSAAEVTDSGGRATFEAVPLERALVFCADHPSYARTCTEPMDAAALQHGTVNLTLTNVLARGRILGHDGIGMIAFVDGAGRVAEEATVRSDGSFQLQQAHPRDEYVVYASSRRPLAILPRPAGNTDTGEMVFTLPAAAVRSFTVDVPGMRTPRGFVGLWIGGRYVPLDMLAFHHDHRGLDVVVNRAHPLEIRDVAETAPITIAFAPETLVPGPFVDPFTRPEYGRLRRQLVSGTSISIPAE
jgi:hypothetical protein